MKILKTFTLRGPNYWSISRPNVILLRLDLEDLTEVTTDRIPGFYQGLVTALPSLEEHFCSVGCQGGFLSRVEDGTLMGHVLEHVALELQILAGMDVGFGRTRGTRTEGVYQVAFEYEHEAAGRYAARAALRLCNSIVETGKYAQSELQQDLADLKRLRAEASLGPTTDSLVREAKRRGLPCSPLETRDLLQLGYGKYQRRVQASLTSLSNVLAVELASDKEGTKQLLGNAGVPVPKGTVVEALSDLDEAIECIGGYPVVIKPLNGNHGRGITLDVQTPEQAEVAYEQARQVSRGVIVEHYYPGRDFRVLVVNHKVVAVAERVAAHVVGDGTSTVAELVEQENRNPKRGRGHDNLLTFIPLDATSEAVLERQGYTVDTVLDSGQVCYLRNTGNLSTGGIAIDRTDEIHPDTAWLAERVTRLIDLDVAGIDLVASDITQPLTAGLTTGPNGVVVEVNAAPGLRMHLAPSQGKPRNVAAPILDMLFPPNRPYRIPIVAVTGTNGKTTTTRLIAHILRQVHDQVGFTTTDGIYIGDRLIEKGDNTGPLSAQVLLRDPSIDAVVLESARGGILRAGLAFDQCDVGVVLNVAADHLGLGDIDTLDQMARVKGVIAETVQPNGYAILNADDPLVVEMADKVDGQVAYFSMESDSPLVRSHVQRGGIAAIYAQGQICILQHDQVHRVAAAQEVPLTLGGRAPFMIANVMAASLAAFVQGVPAMAIRMALQTFHSSVQQTPGRMNLFNLGQFHALVDYAHNPAGYAAVGEFVKTWPGRKIGVVGGPGDRRDQDLQELGALAAGIFDQIIVKEDDDLRGREAGSAAQQIVVGIDRQCPYQVRHQETEAIAEALDNAPQGSLVVIFPESVNRAIDLISQRLPDSDASEPLPALALVALEDQGAQVSPESGVEAMADPLLLSVVAKTLVATGAAAAPSSAIAGNTTSGDKTVTRSRKGFGQPRSKV